MDVVQSSMMIKTKITVRQSVYPATVSVSQDTEFDVVVSLISSFSLVNVKKCNKVRAAHTSSSESREDLGSKSPSSCLLSLD